MATSTNQSPNEPNPHQRRVAEAWNKLAKSSISESALNDLRALTPPDLFPRNHSLTPFGEFDHLAVPHCPPTSAAVAALERTTSVTRLSLNAYPGDAAHLPNLENHQSLDWLSLYDSQITGIHFTRTRTLHASFLDLSRTAITDDCIAQLPEMPRIQRLVLTLTDLSDIGICRLSRFSTLRVLYVKYTRVTERGIADLRSILPHCHVKQRVAGSTTKHAYP
ncbi:leucine-rich repeat domain-containing protein [Gimesia aquarii]|uniref:Leucine Rich repeats (2 copies) n=1 Tax=Gimesia aquarii TaxID=2527964 RepID=A0A517VP76_9PLAN|nr:hypothetical protein [Gimesia aquarii]QDT94818.1 hypothetical protein V144x_02500 [Gimesia aquarii]